MPSNVTRIEDLADAHVGVVGMGRTGRAVLEALSTLGARVSVYDERQESLEDLPAAVASACAGSPGRLAQALTEQRPRLLVVSPGVPATGPVLAAAAACGIETWSEVELAWRLQRASARPDVPWVAVTGTDGKTTTVGMLAAILTAAGLNAPAVGNIGAPVVTTVLEGGADVLTVELSSFQLHTTRTLSPLAAACLNLAPDHLDWHGGYEDYRADKARVYARTRRGAVYNCADEATCLMVREADVMEGCRAVGFTLEAPALGQVGVVDDLLVDRAWHPGRHTEGLEVATLADLAHLAPGGQAARLPAHVLADALAAAALALAVGVPGRAVSAGLRAFAPGAHRLVTVAQGGGVTWVDDSKATNPHSASAALSALEPGTGVWIVGGDTKGAQFHDLVRQVAVRLRAVVVIGADQTEVLDALARQAPQVPVRRVPHGGPREVVDGAVAAAAALARPGDTVMLAPACASWDQFSSYAQRGDLFAAAARDHVRRGTTDQERD